MALKSLSRGIAALILISTGSTARAYTSPFAITLDGAIGAWTTDFPARGATIQEHSHPAPAHWYSFDYSTLPYGPLNPQIYSSASAADAGLVAALGSVDRGGPVFNVTMNALPAGVDRTTWMQQRLLAAAESLIGTHYQHLHLPNFDPALVAPTPFAWVPPVSSNVNLQTSQELAAGIPGSTPNPYAATYGSPQPGIDCTDFAAYIYSLGLGIQMYSGTSSQVKFNTGSKPAPGNAPKATVLDSNAAAMNPQFLTGPHYGTAALNAPGSLDGLITQFQPGDLLYMLGAGGNLSHVVVWLGQYGTNADGTPSSIPLVISSHDNTPAIFDTIQVNPVTGLPTDGDILGHLPPPGVQILPFTPNTWFYQNFSLAMRVIPLPPTLWLFGIGLAAWKLLARRTG